MMLVPGLDFEGTGKLGVWLFFVLSAFLLTRQMVSSGSPLGPSTVFTFAVRRIFRIYPLFVVALLVDVNLGRVPWDRFVPAVTMEHAPNIFWTIPPEFQYYACIPFVAALFVATKSRLAPALVFFGVVLLASVLITPERPVIWPYLGVFAAGSVAALLVDRVGPSFPIGAIAVVCLLLIAQTAPAIMAVTGLDTVFDPEKLRNTPALVGPLWVAVLLAVVCRAPWRRLFAVKPLIWLGEISFGVYLLHPLVIDFVAGFALASTIGFFAVLVGTLGLAGMAYFAVERPLRNFGYALTPRLLRFS